jgi:HAD superfamily phosphatase (TIGR01668 family)
MKHIWVVFSLKFVPDKIFKSVGDITAEILKSEDIKGLVLDIDNTLAPKYIALPDEALKLWISGLIEAGTKLYIISNNRTNRVTKFATALGLPFVCNGMKPFPRSFRRAVSEMGLEAQNIAAVGDQIYTDIAGAHAAGIRGWLVLPIDPRENFLSMLKRRFERPFLNRYYKNNGGE